MTIQLLIGSSILRSIELDDTHPLVNILQDLDKRSKVGLSKREVEILHYVATGMRAKEIGKLLSISTFTIQAHIRNIYKKLGVRTLSEALAKTGIT